MDRRQSILAVSGTALVLMCSSALWSGRAQADAQAPSGKASEQQAQSGAIPSSQSLAELQGGWRSTKLKGATLYNAQGRDIGKVRDLMISNDGQVSGVVLSTDSRTVQVPFKDLQISQPDHVVYNGTQPLDQKPAYIPPEGTQAKEGKVPPLVGQEVRDAKGDKIAKVDDLIIAPDGRVSVILSTGTIMGMGGKLVAVPFSSIQLTGQDHLLYNGSGDQLAQLPKFDYDQLKQSVGGVTTGSTRGQRQGKTE
jgi:sporulation protein YlmC with PRC-barrel domain